MLPATQLPPRQFSVNPLQSSPYCQGCLLRKDTEQAAQGACLENVKMRGTRERLEGSIQRIGVVILWLYET